MWFLSTDYDNIFCRDVQAEGGAKFRKQGVIQLKISSFKTFYADKRKTGQKYLTLAGLVLDYNAT